MDKTQRIEKERERLASLFADLEPHQLQAAQGLINSAAFLAVTLEDLEEEINANGCTEEYQNGRDQYGVKVAASVQAYTALNAKYQSSIQKLLKIVPPEKSAEEIAKERKEDNEQKAIAARNAEVERSQQRDAAFLAAVRDGVANYDTYTEFCAKWEKKNG